MVVGKRDEARLCERSDFGGLLEAAAIFHAKRGIPVEYIEKDYYITECLRIAQDQLGDGAVFKGGTSLSKGWAIIDRFSEDVDLFIDPLAFDPPRGGKAMRTTMKRLSARLVQELPLTLHANAMRASRGVARTEFFAYPACTGRESVVPREVCLASGIGSGREPVAFAEIASLLGECLVARGLCAEAPCVKPFQLRLLHFRRTFVEKLLAIDHAVERTRTMGVSIGPLARHYFDLHALAARPEVHAMLRGSEYREILRDCIEIDRRFYRRPARDAGSWSFRTSPALFPGVELGSALGAEYESQCRILCFGAFPSWREVLARFEEVRRWL